MAAEKWNIQHLVPEELAQPAGCARQGPKPGPGCLNLGAVSLTQEHHFGMALQH